MIMLLLIMMGIIYSHFFPHLIINKQIIIDGYYYLGIYQLL